jgi:hypothetical protein
MIVITETAPITPRMWAYLTRRAQPLERVIPCERGTVHIPDYVDCAEVSLALYQVDGVYLPYAQEVKSDGDT